MYGWLIVILVAAIGFLAIATLRSCVTVVEPAQQTEVAPAPPKAPSGGS